MDIKHGIYSKVITRIPRYTRPKTKQPKTWYYITSAILVPLGYDYITFFIIFKKTLN